ncbi:TlpA family protein disulfide reductase [Phocicoccus pinnipedialis]|uniref:Thiol-disulfide oxidoreductase ResA n=1 Tax=Phocicoccus pinnipedialis TaxID=110845 RepID=A0A6V7R2H3_9BACL|nr:TlpA disulfide reductase family protein [Jeotgalicoccus pinnipedialis]MBP1938787.1 thiol-disulfide isomerase/thioredoxin [Jeotgalicoccus pinnipedialis]CAD2071549.1 Thiol-disulfide oxidoreductase ResA [Jeotgalicoccus pinnipedialis]
MNKKILISVIAILAIVVIGISIYAVVQKSDEILSNSNVETIKETQPHDTHHASGDKLDLPVTKVINADEDLQNIIVKNKVTVVNFFASWCGPCRSETPLLDDYYTDLDDDIALVGVNISDNEKGRNKFLQEFSVDYPIYLFEDETEALERYKLIMIPTTFFLDQEGNIVRVYVGELSNKTLDQYIQFVKEQ